jgi:hypothetical protein
MCDYSRDDHFNNIYSCKDIVEDHGSGEFTVSGKTSAPDGANVLFWAANPPNYNTGFSGSGLPFPSPDIAFDNTPNKGAVKVQDGNFKFYIRYPSSFYAGLGTYYVPPHVYYKVCDGSGKESRVHAIKLGEGIPFRSLTYPPPPMTAPRRDCNFYGGRDELPIRTQEQILRDGGYPDKNTTPDNFWGLVPPQ